MANPPNRTQLVEPLLKLNHVKLGDGLGPFIVAWPLGSSYKRTFNELAEAQMTRLFC